MPIKYRIVDEKKLVYAIGVDKVTVDDLIQHIEDLAHDPAYIAPMKKLVDYRSTPPIGLSIDETKRFTHVKEEHKEQFEGEQCAIVVTRDLDFGISRVHSAYIDFSGIHTNVFRSMISALSWLGVELDEQEMRIE